MNHFLLCSWVYIYILCRNEELQEQLWDVCMRDVKKYLSPETRHKYNTTQSPGTDCLVQSAQRHSLKSSSLVRHKPEDREQLLEMIESTATHDGESDSEGWSDEGEELLR